MSTPTRYFVKMASIDFDQSLMVLALSGTIWLLLLSAHN